MPNFITWRRIFLILILALLGALVVTLAYAKQTRAARVDASAIVVQAQRISAADTLYQRDHDGAHARTVAALVAAGYLSRAPRPPDGVAAALKLDPATGIIHCTVAAARICAEINGQLSTDNPVPVAAGATLAALDEAIEMPYGCAAVAAPPGKRSYRFLFH